MESLKVVGNIVFLTGENGVSVKDLSVNILVVKVKSDYCKLFESMCTK